MRAEGFRRTFKSMADQAAPPNLMGYLFSRDLLLQSIRLGLAGAWDHGHPHIVAALQQIDSTCPALINAFLPISEQSLDESVQSQDVASDDQHLRAQVSAVGFELQGRHT